MKPSQNEAIFILITQGSESGKQANVTSWAELGHTRNLLFSSEPKIPICRGKTIFAHF